MDFNERVPRSSQIEKSQPFSWLCSFTVRPYLDIRQNRDRFALIKARVERDIATAASLM